MIIFIIVLILRMEGRQLVYSFDSSSSNLDQWAALTTLSSNFSTCNGVNILGGSGSFDMRSKLMRYFELKPHYRLYIEVTFYRIDSWDSDDFILELDHQQIYQNTFTYASGTNLCGDSSFVDQIIQIETQAFHNSNFASIEMKTQDNNNDNNESWGMQAFKLYMEPCPDGCDFCDSGFLHCKQWSLQYWDQRITHYYYYDLKLYQTYDCSASCTYSITLPSHQRVMIRFRVLLDQGLNLNYNININNQISVNNYLFGSSVYYALYEAAQLNFQHCDNYISIIVQRTSGTYSWFYIKDFQILIWKDEQKIQQYIPGCSILISNSCWGCEKGWYLDNSVWICVPNQQDNFQSNKRIQVQGQDPYLISKKSLVTYRQVLFNTNIFFSLFCETGWKFDQILLVCLFKLENSSEMKTQIQQNNQFSDLLQSTTNKCEYGWQFDIIISQCIPICGDYLIIGNEQCDDGNQIHFDGCFNCQFECILYCTDCQYGICQLCELGFQLIDNICIPICGDGLLIPYQQECDDGNTIINDGCNQCKFECMDDCISCNDQICLKCNKGFKISQKQCIPICGDNYIIHGYEECDDGNDEQYDGCYQCKYSCQQNCQLCQQGLCLDQCSYGLILINNNCESICGNQIITGSEQCDDGNTIQYDGCYQCQYSCPLNCNYCLQGICVECEQDYQLNQICIKEDCNDQNDLANDGCYQNKVEINWICNNLIPSECSYQMNPKIILNYLNQTYSIQYVQLSFTQQVKIIDYQQNMQINVLPEQDQEIVIHSIRDLSFNLNQAMFIIQIRFKQQIDEKSLLSVIVNDNIVNQYNMSFIENIKEIPLPSAQFMSQQQLFYTQQVLKVDQNIIYGLAGISIMTFVLGESTFIKEVLNTLQYLSYLKFINIQYPESLSIFFQISDLLSITPLLQFLHLDSYLNEIYFKEENLQTKGKFAYYQQEADIITNLTCQILQLIGLVILYIFIEFLKKLLYGGSKIARPVYFLSLCAQKLKQNFTFEINRELYKVWRQLYRIEFLLSINGLRSIILINSWDLLFKTFLFLSSAKLNNIRDYTSVSLSLLIISVYVVIMIDCLRSIQQQTCLKNKNSLKLFEIITLFRQMLFQGLLIFLQYNQVLQTILISINNFIYLLLLQYNKGLKRHTNLIQKIIEGTIVLFTLSSVVYFDDFQQYINYQNKVYLSFAQIGILSLALAFQLLKYIIQKIQLLIRYISTKFTAKEISEQKIYAQHSLFI